MDCSVFAVAYATDFAFGVDPATVRAERYEGPLPEVPGRTPDEATPKIQQALQSLSMYHSDHTPFCVCQLPETDDMVCCDTCLEWSHFQSGGVVGEGTAVVLSIVPGPLKA